MVCLKMNIVLRWLLITGGRVKIKGLHNTRKLQNQENYKHAAVYINVMYLKKNIDNANRLRKCQTIALAEVIMHKHTILN